MATQGLTAGPAQRRARRGSGSGLVVLAALLVLAGLASLAIGSRGIGLGTVVDVLFRPDSSEAATIVHQLRVPRTVLAILVGLALGVAGALMQGHTRNPLADPGLLGIEAGAAFMVVLAIFALGANDLNQYAWFAIIGAGLAAAAVFAIGSTQGGPDPVSLVLAGAAITALLGAFTQALVVSDTDTLDSYRFWIVGSTAGRDISVFYQVLPFILGGLLLAAISTPGMNLMQLGDDVARALGLNPTRHKVLGIAAVMLLAGGATAACGPVGFVGLVVPHVARFIAGVDYRWVVPYSGLLGGLLVVGADILGRLVVKPGELQVGIVMAVVGGPIFIALVRRTRMTQL